MPKLLVNIKNKIKKSALSKTVKREIILFVEKSKALRAKKTKLTRGSQPITTMRATNYHRPKNPFAGGMFFLFLILLTTVVLAYKVYDTKDQVKTFKKKEPNQNSEVVVEEEIPVAQNASNLAQLGELPTLLFLDYSTGQVKKREGKTKEESLIYTIEDKNIIDAKYNARSNKLVYAVRSGNQDLIKVVDLRSKQVRQLVSEDHSHDLTAEGAEQNTLVRAIMEISPNGVYATYSTTGWEWCNDKIVRVADGNLLISDYCQSTRWLKEGTRILVYNQTGMATSTGLALTPWGNFSTPVEIDFSKLSGDISHLRIEESEGQRFLAEDVMAADFINGNQVVFLTSSGNDGQKAEYELFIYDETKKSIKLVASFKSNGEFYRQLRYMKEINSVVLAEIEGEGKQNEQSVLSINLDNGEIKYLLKNIGKYSDISLDDVSGKLAFVTFRDHQIDPANLVLKKRKTYVIDVASGTQAIISKNKEHGFIGFAQ